MAPKVRKPTADPKAAHHHLVCPPNCREHCLAFHPDEEIPPHLDRQKKPAERAEPELPVERAAGRRRHPSVWVTEEGGDRNYDNSSGGGGVMGDVVARCGAEAASGSAAGGEAGQQQCKKRRLCNRGGDGQVGGCSSPDGEDQCGQEGRGESAAADGAGAAPAVGGRAGAAPGQRIINGVPAGVPVLQVPALRAPGEAAAARRGWRLVAVATTVDGLVNAVSAGPRFNGVPTAGQQQPVVKEEPTEQEGPLGFQQQQQQQQQRASGGTGAASLAAVAAAAQQLQSKSQQQQQQGAAVPDLLLQVPDLVALRAPRAAAAAAAAAARRGWRPVAVAAAVGGGEDAVPAGSRFDGLPGQQQMQRSQQQPQRQQQGRSSPPPTRLQLQLPPIELQVAGVKFRSGLGVRQRMDEWVASQTERLHDMMPAVNQLGIPLPAMGQPPQPWAAAFRAHRLNPLPICFDLSVKLGLAEDGRWGAPLPSEPLEPEGVEVRQDSRGRGLGLFTTQPIRANTVICVMGGLMMAQEPDGAVFVERGFRNLPSLERQQLRERVAGSSAPPGAEEQLCWGFLAASFRMAFPGHEDGRAGCGLPPLELQMLGQGGLAAYIHDPRVGDRWGAAAGRQQQGNANCLVVPVLVRGVPLPVLVALRDIAPGEQLLRTVAAATADAAGPSSVIEWPTVCPRPPSRFSGLPLRR
ncbi:hypothetical protein PLESTF_001316700 [Pleodorina starrii]|nr:hypothetical protein PLESTF_001316700 [Pleodorina starrii]